MKRIKSGPAFPIVTANTVQSGMTKREYFAALAMQGYFSSDHAYQKPSETARWAVEQADALIEALKEDQG